MNHDIVLQTCPHSRVRLGLDNGTHVRHIAGPKCCGVWKTTRAFPLQLADPKQIAEIFEDAFKEHMGSFE